MKHGLSQTQEYRIWSGMKARCMNPNSCGYPNYGGRGITVCERWLTFENFFADMGRRPSPRFSLDRFPNKNGDYEPGNVRWASQKQQMNNIRRNIILVIDGVSRTLTEWADISGIPHAYIRQRLRIGVETKKAVFEPVKLRWKNFCREFTKEAEEKRRDEGDFTHIEKAYMLLGWQV